MLMEAKKVEVTICQKKMCKFFDLTITWILCFMTLLPFPANHDFKS